MVKYPSMVFSPRISHKTLATTLPAFWKISRLLLIAFSVSTTAQRYYPSLSQCTEHPYLDLVVNTFSGSLKNQDGYGGRSNYFLL